MAPLSHILIASTTIWMGACQSGTREITVSNNQVRTLAASSEAAADRILSREPDPLTQVDAETIKQDQIAIQRQTDHISEQIPKVRDNVPWWATTLKWVAMAVCVVGVLGVLWYTGIGTVIRSFIYGLGLLIPKWAHREAKFDVEAISTGVAPPIQREAIAAKRASDPAYDAAFIQAKQVALTTRPGYTLSPAIPVEKVSRK